MRKILIGLIAFFYLTGSTGLVVNFHHCMDELASVTLFENKDHSDGECNLCGMDKTAFSCCHDETVSYKIGDSHQPAGDVQLPLVFFISKLFLTEDTYDFAFYNVEKTVLAEDNSPPQSLSNKRYRTLRVFRI